MTIKSMDRMFLPVGQGAFYCERFYNEGKGSALNVVYDCGTRSGMKPLERAVDHHFDDSPIIHAVFISHLDEDHFNGLRYLVEKCTIERVFLPHMSPLDLRLMQLYHETHKATSTAGGQSEETNFVEEVLKCENMEDLEMKLQHFLNGPKLQRDDRQRPDVEDYDWPRPKIEYIDEGDQVEKDIPSLIPGVKIENQGGFSDWKYKAFCIRNNKAVAHVKPALRKLASHILKRAVKRLTPKTVAELIKKSKTNAKFQDSIRKAYSAIGDFNTNSLVLYSGCDNTAGLYAHSVELPCALLRDRSCKFLKNITNQSTCWMFTNAVGCLYTGDFDAKTKRYWRQLKGGFKTEWVTIGCVQIPHHGSKMNYNNEFLAMTPWHVVSARENSKKHPHQEVRAKYKDRCPLFVVTENMNSFAKWCIEEKSSIHRAMFDTVFHGATWMEWYKESGTSVSFKIQEHDEIPLKWGAEREERESQPPLVE